MRGDGDNIIGYLLLALCAAIAGVLVWQIVTGNRLSYHGPTWLAWVLGILFLGGILYGLVRGLGRGGRGWPGRRGSQQWPDPMTGQRGWRRWFGRKDGGR